MHTFEYNAEDRDWGPRDAVRRIAISLDDHCDLEEMCQAFEQYLRACGYSFDGYVQIVEEEDEPIDWETAQAVVQSDFEEDERLQDE